jgi:hypothetical protein
VKSAFEIVKEAMKNTLNTYGLVMNKQANAGNLTVSHFMTILRKLTSFINKDLMIEYFNLDNNYDFRLDLKQTRTASSKKKFKAYISKINQSGQTYALQFINANIEQIVKVDIPSIFDYINKVFGYITIAYNKDTYFTQNSQTGLWSFHITDNDLTKQQQIKQIRNGAKAGRGALSKEDIAKKVWKYRYTWINIFRKKCK